MKALLFTIGLALVFVTAGADDLGNATGTQVAVQVLIAFACIAISALIPEREYKNNK